jgi:hypothetical protein
VVKCIDDERSGAVRYCKKDALMRMRATGVKFDYIPGMELLLKRQGD